MFDFKVFLPSVALALVTGCGVGPKAPADSDGTTTTTTTAATTTTTTTTTTGTSPTSTGGETTSGTTGSTSESVDSSTSDGAYIIIPDLGPEPPCDCAEDELCIYDAGYDSLYKTCVTPPAGCAPQQKCSAACMQACVHPTPPAADCDSDPAEALECDGASSACSLWGQNCPEGQKCAPIVDKTFPHWELECVPLAEPAPAVGEPCLGPEGSPTGKDDCAAGAVCWPLDGNGEKKCVANCGGTPDDPECGPDQVCATVREGTVPACLPICDPLVQDCPMGQVCSQGFDGFACLPDASGSDGDLFDACDEDDACDAGFHCIHWMQQSNCMHHTCCTPFCDVNAPDCPNGSDCVSPYTLDELEPPPGWDHVGVCIKP